jgi:hypothetical protein
MTQHVYNVENSEIDFILSEFSLTRDSIPALVVSAWYGERPEIYNPAFKSYLSEDLNVVYGHTRRFYRLELAINMLVNEWLSNK